MQMAGHQCDGFGHAFAAGGVNRRAMAMAGQQSGDGGRGRSLCVLILKRIISDCRCDYFFAGGAGVCATKVASEIVEIILVQNYHRLHSWIKVVEAAKA